MLNITRKAIGQLGVTFILLFTTTGLLAHEGTHAAGQSHLGAGHVSMMEMSLFSLAFIAVAFGLVKAYQDKN